MTADEDLLRRAEELLTAYVGGRRVSMDAALELLADISERLEGAEFDVENN